MKAYQKLSSGGYQVALFPLEVMHITQGINGSFSHQGSYAIDFVGTTPRAQLYAPCDMELVNTGIGNATYTSLRPVLFPDGNMAHLTMRLVHDNDAYTIPRVVLQGEPIAKTGTEGYVTGDHIHLEVKKGSYLGRHENDDGVWMVTGSEPPYNLLAINDTIIIDDYDYPWKTARTGLPVWLY